MGRSVQMTLFPGGPSVLNIAHRGARSLAPENTLAAARKAFDVGADMWELDVNVTADGELVVLHDETLDRTSNAREIFKRRSSWRVEDYTLQEIRTLDFGSWFNREDPFGQITAGNVSPEDMRSYLGERMPTLKEALAFTAEHQWLVNVEIKDLEGRATSRYIVERVVQAIEAIHMVDRVLVSSFNHEYLRRVKAASAKIATGALVRSRHSDPLALLKEFGARTYHPRTGAIKLADLARLREQGMDVLVWVANDEKTMRKLVRWGVSGIFTDFPQKLKRIL